MGSSLDHVFQALNIPEDPSAGPRGGQLDEGYQTKARKAPLNAETIENLPTLHRFKKPDTAVCGIQNEQPWHRMAAYMMLSGRSREEIAAAAGMSPDTVSKLRAQRWFQELLAVLANEAGEDILGVIKGEALASVNVLVEIRDDVDAPTRTRLAAAQVLLEQTVGKPTQKVVSSSTVTHLSPQDEMRAIQEELDVLRRTSA